MGRISDAVEAVAATLESLGLEVKTEIPWEVSPPAASVLVGDIDYSTTFNAETNSLPIDIDLFFTLGPQGLENLYEYLDVVGPRSIIAAFELDPTLGGAVEFVTVLGAQSPNTAEVGQGEYAHSRLNLSASLPGVL
jgi:hypothetical protein